MVVHQVAAKVKKSLVFIVINPTFLWKKKQKEGGLATACPEQGAFRLPVPRGASCKTTEGWKLCLLGFDLDVPCRRLSRLGQGDFQDTVLVLRVNFVFLNVAREQDRS